MAANARGVVGELRNTLDNAGKKFALAVDFSGANAKSIEETRRLGSSSILATLGALPKNVNQPKPAPPVVLGKSAENNGKTILDYLSSGLDRFLLSINICIVLLRAADFDKTTVDSALAFVRELKVLYDDLCASVTPAGNMNAKVNRVQGVLNALLSQKIPDAVMAALQRVKAPKNANDRGFNGYSRQVQLDAVSTVPLPNNGPDVPVPNNASVAARAAAAAAAPAVAADPALNAMLASLPPGTTNEERKQAVRRFLGNTGYVNAAAARHRATRNAAAAAAAANPQGPPPIPLKAQLPAPPPQPALAPLPAAAPLAPLRVPQPPAAPVLGAPLTPPAAVVAANPELIGVLTRDGRDIIGVKYKLADNNGQPKLLDNFINYQDNSYFISKIKNTGLTNVTANSFYKVSKGSTNASYYLLNNTLNNNTTLYVYKLPKTKGGRRRTKAKAKSSRKTKAKASRKTKAKASRKTKAKATRRNRRS